jgi:hypothetical protein
MYITFFSISNDSCQDRVLFTYNCILHIFAIDLLFVGFGSSGLVEVKCIIFSINPLAIAFQLFNMFAVILPRYLHYWSTDTERATAGLILHPTFTVYAKLV